MTWGAMSSAGIGLLFFIKSKLNADIDQGILEQKENINYRFFLLIFVLLIGGFS